MIAAATVQDTPHAGVVEVVRAILAEIVDPEIPAISIVDLGIVRAVTIVGRTLEVEILPTFIGCPALDLIRATVFERLEPLRTDPATGIDQVLVAISFAEPWTAARISERGRDALTASGFARPDDDPQLVQIGRPAACPFCGSRRTVVENAFGPTRCRSINYCTECRQPFEQFKAG